MNISNLSALGRYLMLTNDGDEWQYPTYEIGEPADIDLCWDDDDSDINRQNFLMMFGVDMVFFDEYAVLTADMREAYNPCPNF